MVRPNYQEAASERYPLSRLPPQTWSFGRLKVFLHGREVSANPSLPCVKGGGSPETAGGIEKLEIMFFVEAFLHENYAMKNERQFQRA